MGYVSCKTAGELIAFLQTVPPDTPVFKPEHHMETGYGLKHPTAHKSQYGTTKRHCVDAFDGCHFTAEVVLESQEGDLCIIL